MNVVEKRLLYAQLTFNDFQAISHRIALDKGWWTNTGPDRQGERNFGEMIALIHSELSEALEAYRETGIPSAGSVFIGESGKPYGIGEEFADVFIRIWDICERYGIPLKAYIAAKLAYNETRPYRHGGKLA